MPINVAIDGPAGAGKSTIARGAAKKLGFIYVDTGALYRAVGVAAMESGIPADDAEKVGSLLDKIKVELVFKDGEQRVLLNGQDVSEKVRLPEAGTAASKVSAMPKVRDFLFALQRDIAKENNVIMDGRDIGTVVLPYAQVKIFLTAAPEERARRRVKDFADKGIKQDFEKVLEEIKQRDYSDINRKTAPLKKADDAVLLDTTDLSLDESIEKVIALIKDKVQGDTQL